MDTEMTRRESCYIGCCDPEDCDERAHGCIRVEYRDKGRLVRVENRNQGFVEGVNISAGEV